jgi:hypothetical protein
MFPTISGPETTVTTVAQVIQLAVAPVFLLAGIGAFLNVCASRLARIVDRARAVEPRMFDSRGREHDRLREDLRLLDRRIKLVSQAIFLSVLSALLICAVVVLLFAGGLTGGHFGTAIALLFIAAMVTTGGGFFVFLVETRVASRSVRVRNDVLHHKENAD